jgi:hypothetical protein
VIVSKETKHSSDETKIDPLLKQCHDFWFGLFQKAMDNSPFDTLCTLLRPGGAHTAGWDVLDEAGATFKDFNWMLDVAQKTKGKATARRFALYYYCFLVEMTAIHEMMMNLLRCVTDQHYLAFPFQHLYRRKKKNDPWDVVPPSMARKIKEIVELATKAGEMDLVSKLNYVFDDKLRNAIAHSDYVLTAKQLRRESGPASAIPLTEVDRKLNYTFRFLSGLLKAANNMRYALRRAKKYHKWDNYEVLELLADENGVFGFNVHFSNGNKSTFSRTKDGVTQINMRTSKGIGFMIGMIDRLEPIWKIDGVPVTDWEELSKRKASEPE